ncbi:hypothetical protein [Streptomyces sp. NPDC006267]
MPSFLTGKGEQGSHPLPPHPVVERSSRRSLTEARVRQLPQ